MSKVQGSEKQGSRPGQSEAIRNSRFAIVDSRFSILDSRFSIPRFPDSRSKIPRLPIPRSPIADSRFPDVRLAIRGWRLPDEFVSHAMDREDVLRLLHVGFDLLAQPSDMHIHGARRRHRVIAPDFVQEFFARECRFAMLDEVLQQQELARCVRCPGDRVQRLIRPIT